MLQCVFSHNFIIFLEIARWSLNLVLICSEVICNQSKQFEQVRFFISLWKVEHWNRSRELLFIWPQKLKTQERNKKKKKKLFFGFDPVLKNGPLENSSLMAVSTAYGEDGISTMWISAPPPPKKKAKPSKHARWDFKTLGNKISLENFQILIKKC